MSFDINHLYKLLPAFYRIRDLEGVDPSLPEEQQHGPLKDLLAVVADQLGVLEENLAQLYDDQFIETAAEWAVPYIGELVATRGLAEFPGAPFSQRAEVANTIMYRRRKGTAAILEQLAQDITGWDALAVEYFQLLATTQYLNHLRLQNISFTGLRSWELLEYINTPFDKTARTADVRRIESNRGKYNIPGIGIHLWRIQAFAATHAPAYRHDDRRFSFNALGRDTPLYNRHLPETDVAELAGRQHVSMPLSRRVAGEYLETYYGKEKSILIFRDDVPVIPGTFSSPATALSDIISICNLSDIKDSSGNVTGWMNMPSVKIAIDPVLGRIAFPAPVPVNVNIYTNYFYGFSAEMGGGEYNRVATFTPELEKIQLIHVPGGMTSINDALQALALTGGVLELEENEYYIETPVIRVAAGKHIEIRAADSKRAVWVLDGDLNVSGDADAAVTFNGILFSGGCIRVPAATATGLENELGTLTLQHCTLLPGSSPVIKSSPAAPDQPRLIMEAAVTAVVISNSICGAVRVREDAHAAIDNSIIDAGAEEGVAYAASDGTATGAPLVIKNSTVVGKVNTMMMELAANTIFYSGLAPDDTWLAPVTTERLQEGCVRFSYIPPGSRIPRPYHCQPERAEDAAHIKPVFTSLDYADAGYGQLSGYCAPVIRNGADDESEMGAFHNLYQPQREANLRRRLNEYLRFGMEAGIYYAS